MKTLKNQLFFLLLLSSTFSFQLKTSNKLNQNEITTLTTRLYNSICFINKNGTVFDLTQIKNKNEDYRVDTQTETVFFSLCQNQFQPCQNKAGTASVVTKDGKCFQIAGENTASNELYLLEDRNKDNKVVKSTIRMVLPKGEVCKNDTSKNYQMSIDLICTDDVSFSVESSSGFDISSCDSKLIIKTSAACPKYNIYGLWNTVLSNKFIFGCILILIGLFFCFVGENFLKITQIIAGCSLAMFIFLYLVFNNTEIILGSWVFWVVIGITVVIGGLAGYFMSKVSWLPGLIFGILFGIVLGYIFINIGLNFLTSNLEIFFWVTLCVCIIVGAVLGFFKEEEISIISTAFVGGYGIIRGISIMVGGFPDERQVYELGSKGEWKQMSNLLNGMVFLYLAGVLVFAGLGMYVQFKYFYDGSKKKKEGKEGKDNKNNEEQITLVKNEVKKD